MHKLIVAIAAVHSPFPYRIRILYEMTVITVIIAAWRDQPICNGTMFFYIELCNTILLLRVST